MRRLLPAAVLLALLLAGCKTELYQGLSEASANAMLIALLEHGISAQKNNLGKAGFSVSVDEENELLAFSVLRDLGLPRPDFESLGTVFHKEGMMSSQTEERSRLSYALSQELAGSCAGLDGIVAARAHVVLSQKDMVNNTFTPASVAVMLRHTPEAPVDIYVPRIQKMVLQAVPDVEAERIAVLLFPAQGELTRPARPQSASLLGIPVLKGGESRAMLIIILFLLLGCLLGGGAALAAGRLRRGRER
jgi:type III secretion protein J